MIRTESLNGFYSFHMATDPGAPTGNYEAKVKVGSVTFNKTIKIETIMPNRLKIKFDFLKKELAKDDKQSAKMEVHWLHGAVAKNLKADVEVTLSAAQTTFPKYSEFVFDDPTRKFSADKQQLFDGKVDENGKATVNADIQVQDAAPGMLQANFVTKVFEPGGNFNVDRFSIPYHPYNEYVGVRVPKGDKARGMLLTDTTHIVQIVTLDKNGKPVSGKRKIEIEFYQVEWKWWWDKSDENLTNYTASRYNGLLRDTITTENGEGKWNLRLSYPNWGRYLLRVCDLESGHCAGKIFYMDWPGWAGRGQRDQAGTATMLTFTSDKEKYLVGENATLTIPAAKNSRALICIESGTRILKSYWAEGKEGETQFKFPVTPDMTPNVYVNVTLVQPHSQTVNDLPIRMYGVIPLLVENANTHLTPVIKMADVLRPELEAITVKEQQGKAMTYTLAVVDEGLLDITRFKTPDPWNYFYLREASMVIAEDFKLASGTWVSVGPLRARFIAACAPLVRDVVIAGINRDEVSALVILDLDGCRLINPALPADDLMAAASDPLILAAFRDRLLRSLATSTGSSTRITRAILIDTPLSIDRGEVTDKGSINQRAVLEHRAPLIEQLYSPVPTAGVITLEATDLPGRKSCS